MKIQITILPLAVIVTVTVESHTKQNDMTYFKKNKVLRQEKKKSNMISKKSLEKLGL